MSSVDVDAYCTRIGYSGPYEPTLSVLQTLQLNHLLAVSFENLDLHLAKPIDISLEAIQKKIVGDNRGGYCYEQNTLFFHVLRQFGFKVSRIAARVKWGVPDGVDTGPIHVALLVELEGKFWLVDVAFGGMSPSYPMDISSGDETLNVNGVDPRRRLCQQGELISNQVNLKGEWQDLYTFTRNEIHEIDCVISNWFTSTHPGLCRSVIMLCRVTREHRYTFMNDELSIWTHGGENEKRNIESPQEFLAVLQDYFKLSFSEGTLFGPADAPFPKKVNM